MRVHNGTPKESAFIHSFFLLLSFCFSFFLLFFLPLLTMGEYFHYKSPPATQLSHIIIIIIIIIIGSTAPDGPWPS